MYYHGAILEVMDDKSGSISKVMDCLYGSILDEDHNSFSAESKIYGIKYFINKINMCHLLIKTVVEGLTQLYETLFQKSSNMLCWSCVIKNKRKSYSLIGIIVLVPSPN